jgi:ribose transport system ATP-binding protein
MTELARLTAITKSFGGVRALQRVDFDVQGGEVHALIGENGAGKSTLMRVLGGEMTASSGEIYVGGQRTEFRDPRAARAWGIAIIHQELALAPDLSVAENIFLGELSPFISWSALRRRARELIETLGFNIDPAQESGILDVGRNFNRIEFAAFGIGARLS